ncbi:MAG: hypothetical protein IH851_00870 [Armatimonadetes bacterium]|nr:hypothetical protein [Armatimonadota bacterium]
MKYLESKPLPLPEAVIKPPKAASDEDGYLTANFERGSLLLRDLHGRYFRLHWDGENQKAQDRRRALPTGAYMLTGYRIIRRDEAGTDWFISGTGERIRRIRVSAGEERPVFVSDAIVIAKRYQNGAVNMAITGVNASGLSIYKDWKRIPIGFRLSGTGGKVLAEGRINYG